MLKKLGIIGLIVIAVLSATGIGLALIALSIVVGFIIKAMIIGFLCVVPVVYSIYEYLTGNKTDKEKSPD